MDPDLAAGRLQRARSGIRQALAQVDAADLQRVENSRELLVAAVTDMRHFESAVRAGEISPTADLYATLLAVKQEITQATRVVDACVAFHRGLAARTGGAPPIYDAEGHIAGESADLEPVVLA